MKKELKNLLIEMKERDFHVDEMGEVLQALTEVAHQDNLLHRIKKIYPNKPTKLIEMNRKLAISAAEECLEDYGLDYNLEDLIDFKNEIEEYEQER